MSVNRSEFASRHIGTGSSAQQEMLDEIGYADLEALMTAALPLRAQGHVPLELPEALGEVEVIAELRKRAQLNTVNVSMLGQGYYGTATPAVIGRNVLENPAWYTAYTPYQPEISQGRLEALLNFQTMVTDLTGMDIAGASMLDEATAAAEGMLLARRGAKKAGSTFYLDADTFTQTKAVLYTRAQAVGIEIKEFDAGEPPVFEDAFAVMVSYPAATGCIRDSNELAAIAQAVHDHGGLLIAAADLLALTLIPEPGVWGADVVVGSTQRFGVPMGYGGPHAGYLAVRDRWKRQLPGRLVGVSKDADGGLAYRLALQTREQHIRRQKATSNICTAQVLLAVMASMYAVYHGPVGLKSIAEQVHSRARVLAQGLAELGVIPAHEVFFDTVSIVVPGQAEQVVEQAHRAGILLFAAGHDEVRISCDELTTPSDIENVIEVVGAVAQNRPPGGSTHGGRTRTSWGADSAGWRDRNSAFLTHEVFNSYHSETTMMRYLRRLSDKDYALDRGMIPLGSCTMKLNAATEMLAISWPQFAQIHPYAPAADTVGYQQLITELAGLLADITGYDAVSLQPNAGSQGELAGLLAIKRYHEGRGQGERNVCIVPASAHGTNAASAVLAGLDVAIVATAEGGDIDLADLRRVLEKNAGKVAAIMVTYPSTHGVYEDTISTLAELVHQAGGQVYIDGANLNALVGWAKLAELGGDVSHLNLHKTFAIPHGGGGPGMGPIAVKNHLRPYLPADPGNETEQVTGGAVSAAPFGSASILPITWAYIRLMGAAGLREATATAVLAANYLARKLEPTYPILYRGSNGLVAHECIVDLREMTAASGITVDDVCKRLIDYGFHAPTMSFPVPGTLMVEPTESEDKDELERFIAAMEAIRSEAEHVESGQWPAHDNPLVNAPHTAASAIESWDHPYSASQAVYPLSGQQHNKYWPPVRRIDGAWGDRNLMCSCPPMSAYEDAQDEV